MKKGRSVKKRAAQGIRWSGVSPYAPRATLAGSGKVLIENHLGIIEFTPERVRLRVKRGEITVEGEGLSLAQAYGGALVVEGRISSLSLPRGEGSDV